jgi:hypothetical protein
MNKQKLFTILLSSGLLLLIASILLNHFYSLDDFFSGIIAGVGIGLLFLSVLKRKPSIQ